MARPAASEARIQLGPNYAPPCRLTQDGPAGPVERSARHPRVHRVGPVWVCLGFGIGRGWSSGRYPCWTRESQRSVAVVQPFDADEFDVATAPRFDVQRRIERQAEKEEACVLGPGPESVSGFDEPIQVATTDHLAGFGFADRGDAAGGRIGVVVRDNDVQLLLNTASNDPRWPDVGPFPGDRAVGSESFDEGAALLLEDGTADLAVEHLDQPLLPQRLGVAGAEP